MTVTLDFTTIFAWIGGLVCAAVTLWLLGWGVIYIHAVGKVLGLWEAIGEGLRNVGLWLASKFRRQS